MADKGSVAAWKAANAAVYGSSNPTIDPDEVQGITDDLIDTVKGEIGRDLSSVTTGNQNVFGSVVKVVATSNIPSLSGLQTIGGYTLQADDLVLLTAQTNTAQNKLKVAKAGAWTDAVVSNYQNLEAYVASNNTVYQQVLPGTSGYQWKVKYQVNVAPARPEIKNSWVAIATNGQSSYQLDAGLDILSVWLDQPDITKILQDTSWIYTAETGVLTLNADAASRCKYGSSLMVQEVTYGSGGAAYGLVFATDGTTLYWRYANESDAQLKVAGSVSVIPGIISVTTPDEFAAAASGPLSKIIDYGDNGVFAYQPNKTGSNKITRGVFWQ